MLKQGRDQVMGEDQKTRAGAKEPGCSKCLKKRGRKTQKKGETGVVSAPSSRKKRGQRMRPDKGPTWYHPGAFS